MLKAIPVAVTLILCSVAVAALGRAWWYPIYGHFMGRETVQSVLKGLRGKIEPLYSEMEGLVDGREIALIGLKTERVLELWKHYPAGWKHVKDFRFTGFSGGMGPKLREGDGQIPEGIYEIEYLNPNSRYHLSMKLTYPNEFDRRKGGLDGRSNLGNDIFIHGNRMTVGCIPIGDPGIEELFYIIAKNGKENTRVIVSPYDMRKGFRTLDIGGIEWEAELYQKIRSALLHFEDRSAERRVE